MKEKIEEKYVGLHYRILLKPNEKIFLCLPIEKDGISNQEYGIPGNEIVKIVKAQYLFDIPWYVVEYQNKNYLITEQQIKNHLTRINVRRGT